MEENVIASSSATPESPNDSELEESSAYSRIRKALTNVTVEPLMMCYLLPTVLLSITSINLTLEKVCRVNLGLEEDTCDALGSRNQSYSGYEASEQAVQTLAANMAIAKNIIQGCVTTILLLFLGSWSDKHKKRKPLMMIPIFGEIFTCSVLVVCKYFFLELPVEVNVLAESIPYAFTGGWYSMWVGTYSYISEISSPESRTSRIGNVQIAMSISSCLGIAMSGLLLHRTGYYGVFGTCLAMLTCGYLYGFFCVKDICEYDQRMAVKVQRVAARENGNNKWFFVEVFNAKNVNDTVRVVFASGIRNRRSRICWILILTMLLSGPTIGEGNVSYFYVSKKYGWDAVDVSIFGTFRFIADTLGVLFCVNVFGNYYKLDDSVLGMISTGSKMTAAVFYAFGTSPFYHYLGAVIESLNSTSVVAMRSIISKLVTTDELGKVNSIISCVEAFVPILYGPVYSTIYAATIAFFPGAFWVAGATLTIPAFIIFTWLYAEHCRDVKEEQRQLQEAELISQPQCSQWKK